MRFRGGRGRLEMKAWSDWLMVSGRFNILGYKEVDRFRVGRIMDEWAKISFFDRGIVTGKKMFY